MLSGRRGLGTLRAAVPTELIEVGRKDLLTLIPPRTGRSRESRISWRRADRACSRSGTSEVETSSGLPRRSAKARSRSRSSTRSCRNRAWNPDPERDWRRTPSRVGFLSRSAAPREIEPQSAESERQQSQHRRRQGRDLRRNRSSSPRTETRRQGRNTRDRRCGRRRSRDDRGRR